ncbi:DUF6456 domain-containing protein [Celeribacter litoreus]|uniref:DUF6456 domain-containing protein n=1 Tax=Celeribacter litoreus TaxID=2876714 RepID=UPI001CCF19CF|nr:DUF6456 domain-containing protein [Celeribacter litoreus]MCA0045016.1 helix-turn-helix domain-containing protein [Celeribacter litoreus]
MLDAEQNPVTQVVGCGSGLPDWVPQEARHYIEHTERGDTIRALARRGGCAPSTVMRQVRKIEQKRDDPLVDEALNSLRRVVPPVSGKTPLQSKEMSPMSELSPFQTVEDTPPDDATIEREARRVLRRLSEPGACLAVAQNMDKAVVVRDLPDGRTTRTAVLDRPIAQALALKDWIVAGKGGKITRYTITSAGRAALRQFTAADEMARAGFSDVASTFEEAPAWVGRDEDDEATKGRIRYQAVESPVMVLARRRDKSGEAFLTAELVSAAERLREDFELAQIGGAQDWEACLIGGRAQTAEAQVGYGPEAAKTRVAAALADLGPGLGDVALRCCCYLEGMEQAEQRMGWSARSGKIVLRIALQRLKRHYDCAGYNNLIG